MDIIHLDTVKRLIFNNIQPGHIEFLEYWFIYCTVRACSALYSACLAPVPTMTSLVS